MTNTDDIREEFEAPWTVKPERSGDGYSDGFINAAWRDFERGYLAGQPQQAQRETELTLGMIEAGANVVMITDSAAECAEKVYRAMRAVAPQPAPSALPEGWEVGRLVTLSQDGYPGLGEWFAQIWCGDDVVARIYGKDHEQIQERIDAIHTATPQLAEQQPDITQLVEALERIVAWPNGGNQYGQANIKIFAAEALATHRKQGVEP